MLERLLIELYPGVNLLRLEAFYLPRFKKWPSLINETAFRDTLSSDIDLQRKG